MMARRAISRDTTPPIAANIPPRVVIEAIFPEVDGGRFPSKRTAGERVEVTAHLFADGADRVAAVLRSRALGAEVWQETPLLESENDEWHGSFEAVGPGMMEYTVEAWVDLFGTWRVDLEQRVVAQWDVSSDLLVGAGIVAEAAQRAAWPDAEYLRFTADLLADSSAAADRQVGAALDPKLAACMTTYPDRTAATRYETRQLLVDRPRARFGAWYELFPRSAGTSDGRSGTFRDVIDRLPDVAAMGFDVLYLPPIHPIGRTHRKGANNRLEADARDPGSPWAIGASEGGHTAVHPELGTLTDFDALVAAAEERGLEIALDLALQCSPDHPWVSEHPEWFRHRPDGAIRYAENPPKRYEDIYPLDLACAQWEALWAALRAVVEFWVEHGVLIFRVDNPHTKPFAFWAWLIREVKGEHPDVIFLAEAFTRPKRMYALAKRGFDQSYSYFTWRNTKQELETYFTEVTRPPVSDFFRPNLFTNTPDILPLSLQTGGRAAFAMRVVLAATLGPAYGVYSGFELIDDQAILGTEEYRDSEKYQLRHRDWDTPGNIKPLITRLNDLRRGYAPLQYSHALWFLPVDTDAMIAFMKASPDETERVLVIVNLDVSVAREGWVALPLAALDIQPEQAFEARDLLNDDTFTWRGEWNRVHLDPAIAPARIFVFRRGVMPGNHE